MAFLLVAFQSNSFHLLFNSHHIIYAIYRNWPTFFWVISWLNQAVGQANLQAAISNEQANRGIVTVTMNC